ncbi:hypothetical protein NE237_009773 [Protea cynaroides]|uniref:Uncharacterized protein n=1 Tax=Protea cynaroides TaxID=273540 RepID=A0A9Q0KYA7_9MAGN|nr:hypothetical protein NE237_009773 [Protea cynaroides]
MDKECVGNLVKLIDKSTGYIFAGIQGSAVEFCKIAAGPLGLDYYRYPLNEITDHHSLVVYLVANRRDLTELISAKMQWSHPWCQVQNVDVIKCSRNFMMIWYKWIVMGYLADNSNQIKGVDRAYLSCCMVKGLWIDWSSVE